MSSGLTANLKASTDKDIKTEALPGREGLSAQPMRYPLEGRRLYDEVDQNDDNHDQHADGEGKCFAVTAG